MFMRMGVVINPAAAQVQTHSNLEAKLRELFSGRGIDIEVIPIERIERDQRGKGGSWDGLVAGGGDGTVNTVARAALKAGLALGVLPLGTRNHFARDLKIPPGLAEAVEVIARGRTQRVDVAEVNGRTFLNNSSIGAYPRAVEKRELYRQKYKLPKMAAMALALLRVFAEARLLWATMELEEGSVRTISPFIFVGNNRYELKNPTSHFRSRIDEGTLSIFTGECRGVADFLRMLWLALRGTLEQSGMLHAHTSTEARILLKRSEVRISTDGEVWRARTPLEYSIHPKALEVFA